MEYNVIDKHKCLIFYKRSTVRATVRACVCVFSRCMPNGEHVDRTLMQSLMIWVPIWIRSNKPLTESLIHPQSFTHPLIHSMRNEVPVQEQNVIRYLLTWLVYLLLIGHHKLFRFNIVIPCCYIIRQPVIHKCIKLSRVYAKVLYKVLTDMLWTTSIA